jgi:hypothetical protein
MESPPHSKYHFCGIVHTFFRENPGGYIQYMSFLSVFSFFY